jgi:hypothetical protein
VFGFIVDRNPGARVLAVSPAVTLLRKGEERLPLLDTSGVTDLAPLMNPPSPGPAVVGPPSPARCDGATARRVGRERERFMERADVHRRSIR